MSNDTQNIIRHWREAVPNDRMAHLIRDTERAFRRALQIRLAAYAVPFGHWAFLRILWEADGLTQKELSERAGVMEPTTFTAIKAMEALGYVVRKQLPTNKKNMYVHLTDEGRALKKKLVPMAEETNHVSVVGVSAEDIKTTRKVLLAMIENLARDELGQGVPAKKSGGKGKLPKTATGAKPGANGKQKVPGVKTAGKPPAVSLTGLLPD